MKGQGPRTDEERREWNEYHKQYRKDNPEWQEYYKTYSRERYKIDNEYRDRIKIIAREYALNNVELIKERNRKKAKLKYDTDMEYRKLKQKNLRETHVKRLAMDFLRSAFEKISKSL